MTSVQKASPPTRSAQLTISTTSRAGTLPLRSPRSLARSGEISPTSTRAPNLIMPPTVAAAPERRPEDEDDDAVDRQVVMEILAPPVPPPTLSSRQSSTQGLPPLDMSAVRPSPSGLLFPTKKGSASKNSSSASLLMRRQPSLIFRTVGAVGAFQGGLHSSGDGSGAAGTSMDGGPGSAGLSRGTTPATPAPRGADAQAGLKKPAGSSDRVPLPRPHSAERGAESTRSYDDDRMANSDDEPMTHRHRHRGEEDGEEEGDQDDISSVSSSNCNLLLMTDYQYRYKKQMARRPTTARPTYDVPINDIALSLRLKLMEEIREANALCADLGMQRTFRVQRDDAEGKVLVQNGDGSSTLVPPSAFRRSLFSLRAAKTSGFTRGPTGPAGSPTRSPTAMGQASPSPALTRSLGASPTHQQMGGGGGGGGATGAAGSPVAMPSAKKRAVIRDILMDTTALTTKLCAQVLALSKFNL